MKTLLTLCLLTLLCFLWSSSAGPLGPQLLTEGSCCSHNRNTTLIPRGKVKNLVMSPTHCRPRSVIVHTVMNKTFCLDPDWSWTQKLQREFGKQKRLH